MSSAKFVAAVMAGTVLTVFAVLVASLLLEGLVVMLVLMGLHGLVSSSIPALGFWASVLVAAALNIVGSLFRR